MHTVHVNKTNLDLENNKNNNKNQYNQKNWKNKNNNKNNPQTKNNTLRSKLPRYPCKKIT